jgi:hypothetical protein
MRPSSSASRTIQPDLVALRIQRRWTSCRSVPSSCRCSRSDVNGSNDGCHTAFLRVPSRSRSWVFPCLKEPQAAGRRPGTATVFGGVMPVASMSECSVCWQETRCPIVPIPLLLAPPPTPALVLSSRDHNNRSESSPSSVVSNILWRVRPKAVVTMQHSCRY